MQCALRSLRLVGEQPRATRDQVRQRRRSNSNPERVKDSGAGRLTSDMPRDMQTLDSRLRDRFFMHMNREQAEQRLQGRLPGTFVLRWRDKVSSRAPPNATQFAISFVDRKTLKIGHSVLTFDPATERCKMIFFLRIAISIEAMQIKNLFYFIFYFEKNLIFSHKNVI